MSEEVFGRYGAYYDLLYRDKDYAGEADYVARTLRSVTPGIRTILEFGSGTGRHGCVLASLGFQVMGIERSQSMVSQASREAGAAAGPNGGLFDCVQGDIRTTALGRHYDAVVSLFHVVSYQTSNDDLRRTFTNAAAHLRPQGSFLFDVWHGPAVVSERPQVRLRRVEDDKTRLWRVAEPELRLNEGVVTVRYTLLAESKVDATLTTIEEEHRMRYLFPPEVEWLADQAGFEVERSEEFPSGQPASDRTWGVAYLLRKKE
jgi:SAM-dependent methyltransferase